MFGATVEEEFEAFKRINKSGSGVLDKTELFDALKEMGKSDREIHELLDDVPPEGLDFEAFKELVSPSYEAYTTEVSMAGASIPVPNPRKVHDVPVLGVVTKGTSTLVSSSYG